MAKHVRNSQDTIFVVIDCLSKQAILILCKTTITAAELAMLFVTHVSSKHSVLHHITSDCVSKFVSHFFWAVGKALNLNLNFTSGYHPEGNGQTECIN